MSDPVLYSDEQVRAMVRAAAAPYADRQGSKGFRKWCALHKVNPAHLSQFLAGIRGPGPTVLGALGLAKATAYTVVRPELQPATDSVVADPQLLAVLRENLSLDLDVWYPHSDPVLTAKLQWSDGSTVCSADITLPRSE